MPKIQTTTSPSNLEKYSFSKLKTFEQCPYQYYLNYIEHNHNGEDNAMSEYGTMCHEILERFYKGELEPFELSSEYEKNFAEQIVHDFPAMPNPNVDLENIYFSGGYDFFAGFEGLEDCKTVLGVEQEFFIECDEADKPFLFRGFIDLLYENQDGELVLNDWKSKSKFASKKELAEYAKQLYIYAAYTKEKYDRFPDKMQFYRFRKQDSDVIEFNINNYKDTWKWVYDTVELIRENCIFEQNKSSEFMCSNLCDFRNICEEGKIGLL